MRSLVITQSNTDRNDGVDKYFSDVNKYPLLSAEEENRLAVLASKGDEEAKNTLVKSNLRFVISVAKKYQGFGLSLGDLINEGNMGLMEAVDKFDPTRGFKLISFAVWWIRQNITAALAETGKIVRIPINQKTAMLKMRKEMSFLEQEEQRTPTEEEMMEYTGFEREKVQLYSSEIDKKSSIDAPIFDDSGETMADTMLGHHRADKDIVKSDLKIEIDRVLNILNKRERTVLSSSFGLFDTPVHTNRDLRELLELSEERIRQIKRGAIKKLRTRSLLLRSFV